ALLRRNRKLLAIEMEGAGIAAAATERSDPRHFIVVRGLSDLADERKAEFDRASDVGAVDTGALRRYALLSAVEYLLRLLPILLQSLGGPQSVPADSRPVPSSGPETAPQSLGTSRVKSEPIVGSDVDHTGTPNDNRTIERNLELALATRYYGTSAERLLH